MPLPPILYKYRRWDIDKGPKAYDHRILTGPEIYFSRSSDFNDPFDCQLDSGIEAKSNAEITDYLRNKYSEEQDEVADLEARLQRERAVVIDEMNSNHLRMIESTSGVTCFSGCATDILSWGHYADGHRGFCVGIGSTVLMESLGVFAESTDLIHDGFSVKYRSQLPPLDPFLEDDREYTVQYYQYKAEAWSYEEEHRFFLLGLPELKQSDRTVRLHAKCINRVILGCHMATEDEEAIRHEVAKLEQVKSERIIVQRAVKSKRAFGLEIVDA